MIVSVCPPHAAVEVAREVAEEGFAGVYLDANATSPDHAREIESLLSPSGAQVIDGSIIGGPAWKSGNTWLHVSGAASRFAVSCFEGSNVTVIDLSGAVGAASAVKMAYAGYTKGSLALLGATFALAAKENVLDAVQKQWENSGHPLAKTAVDQITRVTAKGWRYSGEMREISETYRSAGLPDGFHLVAAEIYERMSGFKDAAERPSLEEVIQAIIAAGGDNNA
jgi:3-hydroxyisobutyrate dehydrogenase-like beta-hydroxyacid dehydrogenase